MKGLTYLVIIIEKISQDVNQGRGQKLSLTDMAHLQNIFVLVQVQV